MGWQGPAGPGEAWQAAQGTSRPGKARRGMVWRAMEPHDMAWHGSSSGARHENVPFYIVTPESMEEMYAWQPQQKPPSR